MELGFPHEFEDLQRSKCRPTPSDIDVFEVRACTEPALEDHHSRPYHLVPSLDMSPWK